MKSRQKNWRESRSRETEVGEKIAVTSLHYDFNQFRKNLLKTFIWNVQEVDDHLAAVT